VEFERQRLDRRRAWSDPWPPFDLTLNCRRDEVRKSASTSDVRRRYRPQARRSRLDEKWGCGTP